MRDTIQCPDITVPSGAAVSSPYVHALATGDAEVITIQSPAVLAETGNIQVSLDFNANYQKEGITLAAAIAAATWADLVDLSGTVIPLGVAGEAVSIPNFGAAAWRIELSGNAAADRTFKVYKLVAG